MRYARRNTNNMSNKFILSPSSALERLRAGNEKYLTALANPADISAARRMELAAGQAPYAIIITCSDSRVVPENIFFAGLGELFVIRIAGNVIDEHQLGSIEYAASHLGAPLIVVLGHTHCGAVDAAIKHDPQGYIKFITDKIKAAIGDEKDPLSAAWLNARAAVREIEDSLEIQAMEEDGLAVLAAVYDLESGRADFDLTASMRKETA